MLTHYRRSPLAYIYVGGLRLAFRSYPEENPRKSACDLSVLRNETRASRHTSHAHDRGRTNTICTPVTRGLVWQLREPNHFSTGHGAVRPLRSAEWRSPIWTAGTERNGTGDQESGPLATCEEAKSAFFEAPRLSSPTYCAPRTHQNSFRAYRYVEFRGEYSRASARKKEEEKKEEERNRWTRERRSDDQRFGRRSFTPALWRPLTLVPKVPDVFWSSLPFLSPLLYPPLSIWPPHLLEDRLGIGRDGNVLRSREEKERGQRLLTGAAGQIPSWIRVSGTSRLSSKKKERGTSPFLSPPASSLLSFFLVPLPTIYLSLHLSGYLPVHVYLLNCSYFVLPASLWTFAVHNCKGTQAQRSRRKQKKKIHFYDLLLPDTEFYQSLLWSFSRRCLLPKIPLKYA